MTEFSGRNYVFSGTKYSFSPVREIITCTDKEAKFWDNLDKQIRRQKATKYDF